MPQQTELIQEVEGIGTMGVHIKMDDERLFAKGYLRCKHDEEVDW